MADIYSISGSFFNSASWNDPTVWDGGTVPTASDNIYIRGVRTTVNWNIGNNIAQLPWSGSTNIRVANHTGFPPSGSFYTYTDRELELKINYGFLSGSNWFGDCTLDTDYEPWTTDIYPVSESAPSRKGGFIPNGAYIQYRPGTIEINNLNISASQIYIENGGALKIENSTTMSLGTATSPGKINVRDGSLIVTGSNLFKWNYHYTSTSQESNDNNVSYIMGENYPFSKIIMEGTETRLNTTLAQSASVGDYFLQVTDASNFAVQDYVFVGEEHITTTKESDDSIALSASYNVSSYDEVFQVCGVNTGSNYLYVQRMNGLDGIIKASASSTVYYVDDQRYQVGDKVVINNQLRTVTAIENDVDYEIRDYNFASGSDLTEWETDVTRSAYNLDWQIRPGLGLTQHISTNYRHLFVKDLLMDEVKVEAWISNYRNISFGNVDRREFGVYIHSNPAQDKDYDYPRRYQHEQRSAFSVDLAANQIFVTQHDGRNDYPNSTLTGSLALNGEKKYTLEYSRDFLKGYINDELLYEQPCKVGPVAGRVGLYTFGNNSVTVTRFKVYAKYQKITLDSAITAAVGDKVYETGVEYAHAVGDEVVKLASVVTDPLDHKNLAFMYRGAEEFDNNGVYPYIVGENIPSGSNVEYYNFFRLAQQPPGVYQFDHGSGTDRSTIIDLTTPTSFSVVGFVETYNANLQQFTRDEGISISGSNDNINFTPITGGLDYRYKTSPGAFRTWDVGDQVYRYIRIETNGDTTYNYNRITGLIVQNFSQSRIEVNNASDFAVGDEIVIMPLGSYRASYGANQWLAGYNATGSAAQFVQELKDHFTIQSKNGNILVLDRPYKEGHIEKGTVVIKVNKNLKLSGSFDWVNNEWKTGRLSLRSGLNPLRRYSFSHVSFQHMNNDTPHRSTAETSGFYLGESNYYDYIAPFKGCALYNCFNSNSFFWGRNYRRGFSWRGCYITANKSSGGEANFPVAGHYDNNGGMPSIVAGNIFHGQTLNSFKSTRSIQIFSYNMVFGGNTYGIPTYAPYYTTYFYPAVNILVAKRNWAVSNNEGIYFGGALYPEGTNHVYKIEDNKLENTLNYPIRYNVYDDKNFVRPIIFGKKSSLYNQRGPINISTNASGQFWINTSNVNYHFISPAITDFNRYGMEFRYNAYGRWYKDPLTGYQKFFRLPQSSNTNSPYMAAYVHVDEGVTASFDLTFDYYVSKNLKLQYQGIESGSAYIVATKNGAQIGSRQVLANAETPTNFTATYSLEGPGVFQIGIAGLDTQTGYIALRNVTSRVVGPATGVRVLSNTLNMKYFEDGDQTLLKTAYFQGPQDPKFRLQGLRIF